MPQNVVWHFFWQKCFRQIARIPEIRTYFKNECLLEPSVVSGCASEMHLTFRIFFDAAVFRRMRNAWKVKHVFMTRNECFILYWYIGTYNFEIFNFKNYYWSCKNLSITAKMKYFNTYITWFHCIQVEHIKGRQFRNYLQRQGTVVKWLWQRTYNREWSPCTWCNLS